MVICGVDPGSATGAIAIVNIDRNVILRLDDLPTHKIALSSGRLRTEFDPHGLCAMLRAVPPDHAVVEAVHALPRQGISSAWQFAHACGAVYGVLAALAVPVSFVTPQRWQQHHRIGKGPDDAVRKALQLYPALHAQLSRKKDHHRADALLIALTGVRLPSHERNAA
jgi:crossover junction endodeoxyribonuclease RuvC